MQRDDLIAALGGHRNNDVRVAFDGARLPITGVEYDPDADTTYIVAGGDRGVWQIQQRWEPGDDEELLPRAVDTLRELWAAHQESGRTWPDFYAWACEVLRHLYRQGALKVQLPADVDPEQPCQCGGTPAPHKPRGHRNCYYTREVTS